jgi:hypothetical protein
MEIGSDFSDLLRALKDAGARYLIVGAHALAYYGRPRAAGRPKDLADVERLLDDR